MRLTKPFQSLSVASVTGSPAEHAGTHEVIESHQESIIIWAEEHHTAPGREGGSVGRQCSPVVAHRTTVLEGDSIRVIHTTQTYRRHSS